MKTTLIFLSLCFCATIYAQDENTKPQQKEVTPNDTPFYWYAKQEERKEESLREKLDSLSLFDLKGRSKDEKNTSILQKKIPVILKMPVYTGPKGLSLMPVIPLDTTNTYYMKVYPAKEG